MGVDCPTDTDSEIADGLAVSVWAVAKDPVGGDCEATNVLLSVADADEAAGDDEAPEDERDICCRDAVPVRNGDSVVTIELGCE